MPHEYESFRASRRTPANLEFVQDEELDDVVVELGSRVREPRHNGVFTVPLANSIVLNVPWANESHLDNSQGPTKIYEPRTDLKADDDMIYDTIPVMELNREQQSDHQMSATLNPHETKLSQTTHGQTPFNINARPSCTTSQTPQTVEEADRGVNHIDQDVIPTANQVIKSSNTPQFSTPAAQGTTSNIPLSQVETSTERCPSTTPHPHQSSPPQSSQSPQTAFIAKPIPLWIITYTNSIRTEELWGFWEGEKILDIHLSSFLSGISARTGSGNIQKIKVCLLGPFQIKMSVPRDAEYVWDIVKKALVENINKMRRMNRAEDLRVNVEPFSEEIG